MKCALELLAISAEKRKENEALEAAKKAFELVRMREEAKANTAKYCQTLENILEKEAANGEDLIATLHIDLDSRNPGLAYILDLDGRNPGLAYILNEERGRYADGKKSFSHDWYERIDLDYLEQWFNKYCFKVEIKDFNYWWFGVGKCHGKTIEIKPDPNCL